MNGDTASSSIIIYLRAAQLYDDKLFIPRSLTNAYLAAVDELALNGSSDGNFVGECAIDAPSAPRLHCMTLLRVLFHRANIQLSQESNRRRRSITRARIRTEMSLVGIVVGPAKRLFNVWVIHMDYPDVQ